MADDLAGQLAQLKKMQTAFELLRSYPTIGDFLAYQFVTDINYSEVTDFSEMDFVIPGPGARDGLRKCFSDSAGLNEAELIRLMADNQEREFERLGIKFQFLWGRRLQLIDCQNLFVRSTSTRGWPTQTWPASRGGRASSRSFLPPALWTCLGIHPNGVSIQRLRQIFRAASARCGMRKPRTGQLPSQPWT